MKNLFSRFSTLCCAVAVGSMAILLAACGDTIENQMGMDVVDSVAGLPKCSGGNEGELAFVTDAGTTYICVDGDWVPSVSGEGAEFSCKTVELKDKSGLKIVCNGDSIGVVLNGEKGESGKDGNDGVSGSGCSITDRNDTAVVVVCGDSTMTISLGVGQSGDSLDGDLDREPISLDSLAGYTQKGPFLKGSTVYLYELSDGRTLKQTNGNFTSSISSDDGRYKFSARDLVSQYAMVVVDGYYRNEVTGATSDATIRLKAITDMRKRSSVNVNLLTHMEYDRVYNLVTKEHKTVKKAKQQAQEEILKIFHIELDGNTDAEDMDVFGKTDADAALLAISVVLQGDRSEADLASLLASLAADLADNGVWDNLRDRAQIADWAMKKTFSAEGLAAIRANVEGWGLGDGKAPAFEGMVTNFWETELKLGTCSKDNKGAIKAIGNKYSAYYAKSDSAYTEGDSSDVRLICIADGDTYAWRYATDIEKNTAPFTDVSEGLAKNGAVNTENVYVYDDGKWRRGTELDMELDFSCIASREGKMNSKTSKTGTTWYTCDIDPIAWREASSAEADTAGFGVPTNEDSIVRIGNVNTSITYVYENGEWRQGTALDRVGDLGACTLDKVNKVVHLSAAKPDEDWYKCDSYRIVVGNGIQVSSAWREATAQEADTAGLVAKAKEIREDCAGIILKGNLTKDSMNYYIYEAGKWRKADLCEMDSYDHTNHIAWEPAAVDAAIKQGTVTNQYYVYDSLEGNWRQSTSSLDLDSDLGGCTSKRSQTYNTLVDRFTTGNPVIDEQLTGNVPGEIVRKIDGTDTLYYVCLNDLWREASVARVETRIYSCGLSSRSAYQGLYIDDVYSVEDMMLGAPYTDNYYVCDKDTFRVITESEKWALDVSIGRSYIRCDPADNGELLRLRYTNTKFVCKNGFYEWDDVPVFVDSLEEAVPFDGNSYEYAVDSAGNKYETVAIGTQLWMATNLRVDIEEALVPSRPYKDTLPSGEVTTSYVAIDMDSIGYYGRLYRYEDAVNACAKVKTNINSIAFHVPTLEEWKLLLSYGADDDFPAKAYKSKDTWGRFGGGDNRYQFGIIAVGEAYESNFCYFEGRNICFESDKFTSFWASNFPDNQIGSISVEAKRWYEWENNGFKYEKSRCPLYLPVRCVADLDIPLPPKNPNK